MKASAGLMVIEKLCEALSPALSITWTEKSKGPTAVGVLLSNPDLGSMVMPVGRSPVLIDQFG